MKTKRIHRRYEELPAPELTDNIVLEQPKPQKEERYKRNATPISQAVVEYYQNLLKEYEACRARHSRTEYRIF